MTRARDSQCFESSELLKSRWKPGLYDYIAVVYRDPGGEPVVYYGRIRRVIVKLGQTKRDCNYLDLDNRPDEAYVTCTFLKPHPTDKTLLTYKLDEDTVHVSSVLCPVTIKREGTGKRYRLEKDHLEEVNKLLPSYVECEINPANQSAWAKIGTRGKPKEPNPGKSTAKGGHKQRQKKQGRTERTGDNRKRKSVAVVGGDVTKRTRSQAQSLGRFNEGDFERAVQMSLATERRSRQRE